MTKPGPILDGVVEALAEAAPVEALAIEAGADSEIRRAECPDCLIPEGCLTCLGSGFVRS